MFFLDRRNFFGSAISNLLGLQPSKEEKELSNVHDWKLISKIYDIEGDYYWKIYNKKSLEIVSEKDKKCCYIKKEGVYLNWSRYEIWGEVFKTESKIVSEKTGEECPYGFAYDTTPNSKFNKVY